MRIARKIICVCVIATVLILSYPVCSHAVDPVSAATMANAFAQAVTAYGASQGVSIMFDVSNTSQIGEQVHELWKRFRSDQQTADDYETIAAAVFPSLYYKAMRAAGAVVGIKLAAEYVADLDGFWNWLLSGPAEMTKVDDNYYEWSLNQQGNVDPISIINTDNLSINGNSVGVLPADFYAQGIIQGQTVTYRIYNLSSSSDFYYYSVPDKNYLIVMSNSSSASVNLVQYDVSGNTLYSASSSYSGIYNSSYKYKYGDLYSFIIVEADINATDYDYNSVNNSWHANSLFGTYDPSQIVLVSDGISVQPYIGDTAPQNVYIPDNEDVNYVPIPADIPLDIPWDDSLYGDGQVLTDAQSVDIADALDLAISNTETLELAEPIDVPADPPSEVYIPLLPVELPSFNFSLSGIWHYVVSWVQSIGAWLSLMFQTWAVLPSAITIPVYATAVIVIVLGVYKRFFM